MASNFFELLGDGAEPPLDDTLEGNESFFDAEGLVDGLTGAVPLPTLFLPPSSKSPLGSIALRLFFSWILCILFSFIIFLYIFSLDQDPEDQNPSLFFIFLFFVLLGHFFFVFNY